MIEKKLDTAKALRLLADELESGADEAERPPSDLSLSSLVVGVVFRDGTIANRFLSDSKLELLGSLAVLRDALVRDFHLVEADEDLRH